MRFKKFLMMGLMAVMFTLFNFGSCEASSYTEQWCNVSAYTASVDECGKSDGVTASGVKAVPGVTISCDHLKFGTKVIIAGHTYIVQDRFGGGYSDRIDIFMNTKSEAFKFGRRYMKVVIINE